MLFTYKHLLYNVQGKGKSLLHNVLSKRKWKEVKVNSKNVQWIREYITTSSKAPAAILSDEKKLIQRIRENTKRKNINNVTRTEAYRSFYFKHPEVHWSFLAHMVSRNGGWNMTDLQGALLPSLLNDLERKHLFEFFERANALIFQDAYPQLLLYEESKKQRKNMFYLLPAFNVSRFMRPFWDHFLKEQDTSLLTLALIINEQHYIEGRVVHHPYFQEKVLQTLKFKGQEAGQLTQVIFPYRVSMIPSKSGEIRLAGIVMENFANVKERIEVGKRLYAILFGIEEVYKGALQFAQEVTHTGSRADYWDHIFTSDEKKKYASFDKERLIACQLIDGAPSFYSPALEKAWEDKPISEPKHNDWYDDQSVFRFLQTYSVPKKFDMTSEYCFGLNKVELAVLAKKTAEEYSEKQ